MLSRSPLKLLRRCSFVKSFSAEAVNTNGRGNGCIVPNVTFKARALDLSIPETKVYAWRNVTSEDLFMNRRVVLFALPGAFTPTCDGSHLPGYHAKYDKIKSLGIDEVYCLSVNDAFVMRRWGLSLGLEEELLSGNNPLNPGNFKTVKLIPDGAVAFTRGMGMSCVWDTEREFGERSWRYSMVINNMIVEKMFIEGGAVVQNSAKDPFECSDADTMVSYLAARAQEQREWQEQQQQQQLDK